MLSVLFAVLFITFQLELQLFIYMADLSSWVARAFRKSLYFPSACSGVLVPGTCEVTGEVNYVGT